MDSPPRLSNDSFVLRFPARLWRIVNTCSTGAIAWGPSGKTIRILRKRFEREYLLNTQSRPFKTSKFASFVRQLNHYGFKKVITPIMIGETKEEAAMLSEYHNPLFARGHPEFISFLHRRYCQLPTDLADKGEKKRKRRAPLTSKTEEKAADGDEPAVVTHRLIRTESDQVETNREETNNTASAESTTPPQNLHTPLYMDIRAMYGALPRGRCYPATPFQYPAYPGPLRGQPSPYRFPDVRTPMPPLQFRGLYGGGARAAIAQRYRAVLRAPVYSSRPYPPPHRYPVQLPHPPAHYWHSPAPYPTSEPYSSLAPVGHRFYDGEMREREVKPVNSGLDGTVVPVAVPAAYGRQNEDFAQFPEPSAAWNTMYRFGNSVNAGMRRREQSYPLHKDFLPVGQKISRNLGLARLPGDYGQMLTPRVTGEPDIEGYPRNEYLSVHEPRPVADHEGSSYADKMVYHQPDGMAEPEPSPAQDYASVAQSYGKKNENGLPMESVGVPCDGVGEMYMKYDDSYANHETEGGAEEEVAKDAYIDGGRVRTVHIAPPVAKAEAPSCSSKCTWISPPSSSHQDVADTHRHGPCGHYDDVTLGVHEETVFTSHTPEMGWERTNATIMPYSSIQETIMIDTLIDTSAAASQYRNSVPIGIASPSQQRNAVAIASPSQYRNDVVVGSPTPYRPGASPGHYRNTVTSSSYYRNSGAAPSPSQYKYIPQATSPSQTRHSVVLASPTQYKAPANGLWEELAAKSIPYPRAIVAPVSNDGDHASVPVALYQALVPRGERGIHLMDRTALGDSLAKPAGDASAFAMTKLDVDSAQLGKGDSLRVPHSLAKNEPTVTRNTPHLTTEMEVGQSGDVTNPTSRSTKEADMPDSINNTNSAEKRSQCGSTEEDGRVVYQLAEEFHQSRSGSSCDFQASHYCVHLGHNSGPPEAASARQLVNSTTSWASPASTSHYKVASTSQFLREVQSATDSEQDVKNLNAADSTQRHEESVSSQVALIDPSPSSLPCEHTSSYHAQVNATTSAIVYAHDSPSQTKDKATLAPPSELVPSSQPQPIAFSSLNAHGSPTQPAPNKTEMRAAPVNQGEQPADHNGYLLRPATHSMRSRTREVTSVPADPSSSVTELTCRVIVRSDVTHKLQQDGDLNRKTVEAGLSHAHLSSASVKELLSAVIRSPGGEGMSDAPCPDKVAFVLREESSGEVTGYVLLDENSK